jgi:Ni/Fe-hydrogenase subunit HybB-like protein
MNHETHVVEAPAPIGGRIWTRFTVVLAVIVLALGGVLAVRFWHGIGAVTNLNDGYPWGLWIAWDVVIGSALGASGFTVAFITYIVNRGEYHPLVRPAMLTALFGYVMAALSVVFDLGRYWNMWHIFWPKYAQPNSVLFEVAVCIAAYSMVLMIESAPMVLERFGFKKGNRALKKVLFFFIALGVLLPTMHQSSLGSMLIVYGPQIDPLYQTRMLPILFLLSTIGMGLAAVTVEGSVTSLSLRRPVERDLLVKLVKIGRALLVTFVVIRFIDLGVRGQLGRLMHLETLSILVWIETALCLAPVALLAGPRGTRLPRLFISAMAMAFAGILYRIDAYLVSYSTGAGWHYFPSMGELTVTIGLIAFEILAFIIAIRVLPVLPRMSAGERGSNSR